ncbi:MAG: SDR family oxidoreductase [Microbacteriaceae bacterium]|nr:MAG: SDR family oxidoreductase [Microbacteriaceae bacterium]
MISSPALVTGAARGIGAAIAAELHAQGCRVILLDSDPHVAQTAADLPGSIPCTVDVRDTAAIEAFLDARGLLPEVVVNNAAIAPRRDSLSLDLQLLEEVMAINLHAPVLLCTAVAARLADAGRPGAFVNVSSVNALRGQPEMLPYNASKAALVSVTQTLAVELAPLGIRVNAVLPGSTRTEIWETGGWSEDDRSAIAALNLLNRLAEPAEIARAVAFLASDDASFVTGHTLIADGGLTVRMP